MMCTALTMIDPVIIRILFWIDRTPDWNYEEVVARKHLQREARLCLCAPCIQMFAPPPLSSTPPKAVIEQLRGGLNE